jgi:glucose-6-phosphate-specific signal transduction histidine kinase
MKISPEKFPSLVNTIDNLLSKFTKPTILAFASISLCVVGLLDYLNHWELSFALFYLVPIFVVAWKFGRVGGAIAAIVSAVVWVSLDYMRAPFTNAVADAWNVTMKVGVFGSFAIVVARVKSDLLEQMDLNRDLTAALDEVKQLSGLLPICAWCKKIRDEQGNWQNIETYVADHSEANFSHGICPECANQRHPAFRM